MIQWESIIPKLREYLFAKTLPSVSQVAEERRDPFRILISTVISLRTKDQVTLESSSRLFEIADTPERMRKLDIAEIEKLIYPAGFYRVKAKNIKRISEILVEKYGGQVPRDMDDLLTLPGVGRKTANLVRNLGYNLKGICVDTHVHRISNRTGWVATKNPHETESELMKILPEEYWIEINELLVKFGQSVCSPLSPKCSICPISGECKRIGVTKSR